MEKYNHNKIAIPIPLALSLILTVASRDNAAKMIERIQPPAIINKPVAENANINTGIPVPIKKARVNDPARPINILSQITLLFKG